MATIGYTSVGSLWFSGPSNSQGGNLITPAETILVSKLTAYIRNDQSGHTECNAKGIIYRDSDKALIATSPEVTITDNAAVAWVDLAFSSAVEITAAIHRAAVIFDSSCAGLGIAYNAASGYTLHLATDTYADGPLNPLSGHTDYSDYALSLYATYTTTPSGIAIPVAMHHYRSMRG